MMNILTQLAHLPNLPTLLVISRFDTILLVKIGTKYAEIHSRGLKTRINLTAFQETPQTLSNLRNLSNPQRLL
jgi:hypothetical protein